MTTSVRSTCPDCGPVGFPAEVVRLRVCRDPRQSFWAFICPSCSADVYRPADDHAIAVLVSVGVPAVDWDVPDELLKGPHLGPVITWDDLLNFALEIEALPSASRDAGASGQRPLPAAAPVTTT